MKKLLLTGALFLSAVTFAQTTLFTEDFESGGANWTLNSGGFGANDWVINNIYVGSFFTTTPSQSAPISPANGNYLHIYNQATGCALFGDCQAVFLAGSGGDKTAEMVNNLSTVGMTNVTFDFWYLCGGASGVTYGMVEYSIDNGSNWLAASPQYAGIGTWNNGTLSDPAWSNQAQLKFRFHWYEGATGNDPSFAVDQIAITASSGGAVNTLSTTNDVSPSSWCQSSDQQITVNYTSTGTWNASNTFTVELSDAAGSFASPTVIASQMSTAGSGSINATVPGATPAGTGYRVRVMASDPATTGSDNGSDLVINALPTVTMQPFSQVCVYDPFFTLTGGSPASGTYSGPGITANIFDPTVAGVGTHTITYTFTDGNSCTNSAQESIVVDACSGVEELDNLIVTVYPNPAEGSFQVSANVSVDKVELLDMNGRVVEVYGSESVYNVSALPNGIYTVRITSGSFVKMNRLILQ